MLGKLENNDFSKHLVIALKCKHVKPYLRCILCLLFCNRLLTKLLRDVIKAYPLAKCKSPLFSAPQKIYWKWFCNTKFNLIYFALHSHAIKTFNCSSFFIRSLFNFTLLMYHLNRLSCNRHIEGPYQKCTNFYAI